MLFFYNFAEKYYKSTIMKRLLLIVLTLVMWQHASKAQELSMINEKQSSPLFKHLDGALVVGTTGIGFDLATPITNSIQIRTGFDFMPNFNYDMGFGIQVGEDPSDSDRKFQKMSSYLKDLTGYEVKNHITMVGTPKFDNFKLLVDVFPLRNKHWHFTAGFYYGSSEMAHALNSIYDMHSLMGVDVYNNIYDKLKNKEPLFKDKDIDPELRKELWEKMKAYGRMGINMGQFTHDMDIVNKEGETVSYKAGATYYMVPDADGTVWAKAKANAFKPYLGAGYEGCLIPGNDRYIISCELGAMFWGGVPSITTHDGVDMINDLTNVRGDVKDYLDFANHFAVYPVLNLRLAIRLF